MQEAQHSVAYFGAESASEPSCFAGISTPNHIQVNNPWAFGLVKRCFDSLSALAVFVVMLIPMGVVALLIRLDSPGPAIFRQERLGEGGRPFVMYKFRSMIVDAESRGPVWSEKDDDRCTRVGRFIRKCRIDELPQLVNIIKGDMSVVGPRPERTHF